MRKVENSVNFEGYLYDCDLVVKQAKNKNYSSEGKKYFLSEAGVLLEQINDAEPKVLENGYIQGTVSIAVDEEGMKVVTVRYGYAVPVYKSGKINETFKLLFKIMKEKNTSTWIKVGKDNALKLQANRASINNNEYFSTKDNSFKSLMRCEGGFLSVKDNFSADRNKFITDIILTGIAGDPDDDNLDVKLKGFIFSTDTSHELIPVEYVVRHPQGSRFFANLRDDEGVSENKPIFTQVRGSLNTTVTITPGGFGEPVVHGSKYAREFLVDWTCKYPYDFGDESAMTKEEYNEKKAQYDLKKAQLRTSAEERESQKTNSENAFSAIPTTGSSGWEFSN